MELIIKKISGIEMCFPKERYEELFAQQIIIKPVNELSSCLEMPEYGIYNIELPVRKLVEMINNCDEEFLTILFSQKDFPKSKFLSYQRPKYIPIKRKTLFEKLFG